MRVPKSVDTTFRSHSDLVKPDAMYADVGSIPFKRFGLSLGGASAVLVGRTDSDVEFADYPLPH